MRALVYITALCVFCGVLMIACNSTAQEKEYVILSGRIMSDSTTVVAGAIVTDGLNSSIVDTTDDRGFFQLRGIDKKQHMIKVEKDGFEPLEYQIEYTGQLARPLITRQIILAKSEE